MLITANAAIKERIFPALSAIFPVNTLMEKPIPYTMISSPEAVFPPDRTR